MPLSPGDSIAGYTIESVIARGGMGVVYRARQLELDRSVALKVIAAERAEDPAFRERFVREARMAASLDHPNVIPIFEAGEDGGRLFIAMRLVEGTDLERLIAATGRLEPERAVELIEQAAAGLDAAHARGLVHRDVKPANILVAGSHVYVSDFGVARPVGGPRLTASSEWVGTADYAAPEQRRGGEVDARADVYALGGVLWAALSGHPPDPERPLRSGGLGPLADVLERALARRPADRPDSAGALAAAARAALAGGTLTTRPARTRVRAAGPRRRRRDGAVPVLAAAALVAAALAVVALGRGSGRPPAAARPAAAPPGRAAAVDAGDTVVCHPAACTQGGRTVAAPIVGGACRRGGMAATWTRIDRSAPEPMVFCLPAAPPPAAGAPPAPVPTLSGARLDRAEQVLDRLGLGHETSGGGLFGIVDRANWTVCATTPPAGTAPVAGGRVKLFVDRSC